VASPLLSRVVEGRLRLRMYFRTTVLKNGCSNHCQARHACLITAPPASGDKRLTPIRIGEWAHEESI
jgi:hypothetical protein